MINTYDNFTGKDLEIAELIQQRRIQMLVHSCIYYNMDENVVSDEVWQKWARELVDLQTNHPEISQKVWWYEAFKDWDASTGAFLPLDDPWVINKAQALLARNRKAKGIKPQTKPVPVEVKKEVKKPSNQMNLF